MSFTIPMCSLGGDYIIQMGIQNYTPTKVVSMVKLNRQNVNSFPQRKVLYMYKFSLQMLSFVLSC